MKSNSKNSRKNNYSLVLVALLIISVLNFSCSKPENGTNGTNGVDGKNGTNGAVGTTGNAGTANVIFSQWITPTVVTSDQRRIIAPQINNDILDRGAVLVYTKYNNTIVLLPYIDIGNNNKISAAVNFGFINIFHNFPLNDFFTEYRYIIIPGGVPSGRGTTITRPDYSQMTYSQVCKSLDISE